MEQGEQKLTLVEKLYNIMSELDYIQKDKENSFHKYSYASEAAIKREVHRQMVKWRVLFYPHSSRIISIEKGFGAKGDEALTRVLVAYDFIDADNPSSKLPGEFEGTGADKGDKGTYKAVTGAIRDALKNTFLIETGNDPEKEEREPEPKEYLNKEERVQAKQAAQQVAEQKIQVIRAEQPKPLVERAPALQLALDRIKDKESGISVLNDWIFELGNEVSPQAVLNFHAFYQKQLGVKTSTEMNVEQLRECVELIWRKIDQHNKDKALGEAVKDAPIGVGADAPPLWVEKPSKASDTDKLAHTGYIEQEKKRQGRR